jgi:DNA-binding response OmpR family regulator
MEGDAMVIRRDRAVIVVADDDPALLRLMRRVLTLEGFDVITAPDGPTALKAWHEHMPNLLILDIMMPGMDGLEVCRHIRQSSAVPIIMLTARDTEQDVVRGLNIGADDYITKPFSVSELLARVHAVLRRAAAPSERPLGTYVNGDLTIDFATMTVTRGDDIIPLTRVEYKLLHTLAANAGKVMTSDDLLTRVWGSEYRGDTHLLRVTVARIREKLEPDPSRPRYLLTRPGIGYYFAPPAPPTR